MFSIGSFTLVLFKVSSPLSSEAGYVEKGGFGNPGLIKGSDWTLSGAKTFIQKFQNNFMQICALKCPVLRLFKRAAEFYL